MSVIVLGTVGGFGKIVNKLYAAGENVLLSGTAPSARVRDPVLIQHVSLAAGMSAINGFYYRLVNVNEELADNISGQMPLNGVGWAPTIVGSTTPGANTYSVNTGTARINPDGWAEIDFRIIMATKDAAMAGSIRIPLPLSLVATGLVGNMVYSVTFSELILSGNIRPAGYVVVGDGLVSLLKDAGAGSTASLAPADLTGTSRLAGTVRIRY